MNLRDYLNTRKIKVSDFSVIIGTAQPTISGYITGTRTPRPEIARRIIEATGGLVTYEDLYGHPRQATKPQQVQEAA